MEITNYTDEDLNKLMEKYKEKQSRYALIYNEATERNEKIIFHIHKEQVRRYVNKNLENFIESKMDIRLD
jgi:NDP-sugar pyrophosphorylase family protein